MPISVTARHAKPGKGVVAYAQAEAESLLEEFPWVEHIHVILDSQKRAKTAEVVVQAKKRLKVESCESAEHSSIAIDAAMDKVKRQLRRSREKVQERRKARKSTEEEKSRGAAQ